MYLHIADGEKEPINAIIDSDDACFTPMIFRIVKMIPVFNIISVFWAENNVQLDTVFEGLKNCDALLERLQCVDKQSVKYFNANMVNHNEELALLPLDAFKEMLSMFKRYRDEAGFTIKDSDLICIKELFYESVRRECFPEKNGRLGTVFFYENLMVAEMAYHQKGKKDGRFCEVEIVETRSLDRYDSRWLTDLRASCIFKECLDAVKNYWKGEMTEHPKMEILFSGKYILKDLS